MSRKPLAVVRWAPWAETCDLHCSVGGIGGWFGLRKGQRWKNYLRGMNQEDHPYLEALRTEIVRRGIRRGGQWHQHSREGVPVFSDGSAGQFSWRAWGDLLAAVWSEAEGVDYAYMDFYFAEGAGDRAVATG